MLRQVVIGQDEGDEGGDEDHHLEEEGAVVPRDEAVEAADALIPKKCQGGQGGDNGRDGNGKDAPTPARAPDKEEDRRSGQEEQLGQQGDQIDVGKDHAHRSSPPRFFMTMGTGTGAAASRIVSEGLSAFIAGAEINCRETVAMRSVRYAG